MSFLYQKCKSEPSEHGRPKTSDKQVSTFWDECLPLGTPKEHDYVKTQADPSVKDFQAQNPEVVKELTELQQKVTALETENLKLKQRTLSSSSSLLLSRSSAASRPAGDYL